MSSARSLVKSVLGLILAAAVLPGCISNDVRMFDSTVNRPTTIRIVQAMTNGNVLWEYDIPVQHSLQINLDREGEVELFSVNPEKPATSFSWALFDDQGNRLSYGKEKLPGLPIRIELALRPAPEWPEGYTPPGQQNVPPPIETLPANDESE